MNLNEYLERGAERYLPNLSIDLIIIGLSEGKLKALLLQLGDKWLVPGGHVAKDESVDEAVVRILKERTGLEHPHMKFLSVFGNKDRSFVDEFQQLASQMGVPWRRDYWLNDRFVTLAYYSLVYIEETHPTVQHFENFAWVNMDELPPMWMDHKVIVTEARNRLKEDIRNEMLAHKLLPVQFTMPELHQLHELILQEKIDRSRFQKKMLSIGIFKRLPKLSKDTPGRSPYQYTANTDII